jgi:transposase
MKDEKAKGNQKAIHRILIVLAVADGFSFFAIANILRISLETVRLNFNNFIMNGLEELRVKKQTGRPPKLTKSQKKRLSQAIIDGPEKADIPVPAGEVP